MKPDLAKVHPELQSIAKNIPLFNFSPKIIRLMRLLEKLPQFQSAPSDIKIKNVWFTAPNDQAKIRLRIYRAKAQTTIAPVLLWLHGGGYIIGRPEQDDTACLQYVREAGVVVVSVAYRYAPEHPFPTGLEDSYAALKWIKTNATALKLDPDRLAIGGNSAGGGLAAALSQLTHDRQELHPKLQLLVYPMLDDRTSAQREVNHHTNFVWTHQSNILGWESYLQQKCGAANLPNYAVPARRPTLAGLPPAWIGVGTLDLFYNEDLTYAQRLKEAGVACEFYPLAGAFHGFDAVSPLIPITQTFRASQIAALKKYLGN